MALDISGDYVYVDGTETITHLTTSGQSSSVEYALRQPLMIQDSSGNWIADSTRSTWELWSAELTHDPAPGHKLTQDSDHGGESWIIETADYLQLVGKWEIMAAKVQTAG